MDITTGAGIAIAGVWVMVGLALHSETTTQFGVFVTTVVATLLTVGFLGGF